MALGVQRAVDLHLEVVGRVDNAAPKVDPGGRGLAVGVNGDRDAADELVLGEPHALPLAKPCKAIR
jgi:hypothetical protein